MRNQTNAYKGMGLEDLLLDYLMYKKSESTQASAQNTTAAWPMPLEVPTDADGNTPAVTRPAPLPENGFGGGVLPDEDVEFMKQLYGELAKRLMPAVDSVLNRHEMNGGAVYDELLDRESLALIVDQILEEAQTSVSEVEDIALDMERGYWGRYRLLRALAESLALHSIHVRRRHCRRRNRNMLDILI